jgi:hypothetical protein
MLRAAIIGQMTAFDLILLKINLGNNTTIGVYDYEEIATNCPLSSPNFSLGNHHGSRPGLYSFS